MTQGEARIARRSHAPRISAQPPTPDRFPKGWFRQHKAAMIRIIRTAAQKALFIGGLPWVSACHTRGLCRDCLP